MLEQKKKVFILLFAVVLLITSIPEFQPIIYGAEKRIETIYEADGLKVEFKVNSKWDNGFEGQFIITNNGNKTLENWRLKLKFDHEISSIWDGTIESHKGNEYLIKHPSWNPNIIAGGKAVIGFNGKTKGKIKSPYNCSIPTAKTDAAKEEYSITYRVSSDWNDAFNGEISITNNSNQAIQGWSLEFDFDYTITSFWTAKIISHNGNHYVIKNDSWNSVIKPGATIKLGFEAKPGNAKTEPTNYKLVKSQLDDADNDEADDEVSDDITEEDLKKDTDKDGLADIIELQYSKTDPEIADTDGDGIPDGYELFELNSDPLVKDSNRDEDKDGLSNLEEYKLETSPTDKDTDMDELSDYDEVKKYKTDPLKEDTDGDTLKDGDEILRGFDPLKPDTDGNGILDGDEKTEQIFVQEFDKEESNLIRKVSIKGKFTKNIADTTQIDNYYGTDVQTTDVEGLVGIPVNIETKSKFDKLDIIFEYETLPSGVKEDNIGVLWYNEKEESYELQDCMIDKEKRTVTFSSTHLSTYMLVDQNQWNKIWNTKIKYGITKDEKKLVNTAYVLDYSKSMTKLPEVKKELKEFVNTMDAKEKSCVIGYRVQSVDILSSMTANKETLENAIEELTIDNKKETRSGAENLLIGIDKAIIQLSKNPTDNGAIITLIGDTDVSYSAGLLKQMKDNDIRLFVINVKPNEKLAGLKKMAKETNGFYYELSDMEFLSNILNEMKFVTLSGIPTSDKDDDGLFDVYEKKGMRICNGKVLKSDPDLADTDGDGATDFEEMGYVFWYQNQQSTSKIKSSSFHAPYYRLRTYLDQEDSDLDGLPDYIKSKKEDPRPKSQLQIGTIKNYKSNELKFSYKLGYTFDFSWFTKNTKSFNKNLQHVSSILATLAYHNSKDVNAEQYKMTDERNNSTQTIGNVLRKHGFAAVKEIYLGDKYKDNNIVQFDLAKKEIYGKEKFYVVPIVIRGTKGRKEWFSNFDVGNTEEISKYEDWKVSNHHKGFDISANRVIEEVEKYLKDNSLDSSNTVLWIMGHSRGGAVANLVSKKMVDLKYKTYAYTFATPNVTTDKTASADKYSNIFNLVNKDDFIPELPLKSWGFKKYGKTIINQPNKQQKSLFKTRTTDTYKNLEDISIIIDKFGEISDTRNGCYQYTCACHSPSGKQEGKSIQVINKSPFIDSLYSKYKSLSKELKESCRFVVATNNNTVYTSTMCQTPMFFMNQLAVVLSGDRDDGIEFGIFNVATKYEDAKWKLIYYQSFIKHPHFADSYIILSD